MRWRYLHAAMALGAVAVPGAGCGAGSDVTIGLERIKHPLVATDHAPRGSFISTADVEENGFAFSTPVTVEFGKSSVGYSIPCVSLRFTNTTITNSRVLVAPAKESLGTACTRAEARQKRDLRAFFLTGPSWELDRNRLTLSNDNVEVDLQKDATPAQVE